ATLTNSAVTLTDAASGTNGYRCIITGTCSPATNSSYASLMVNTAPAITNNPGSQTVCLGSPAIFSVTATGAGLTYQWYKDGAVIGGATYSSYTNASVTVGDAGD